MAKITREFIDNNHNKPLKFRAIRDRSEKYENHSMNYKKGDIIEAKILGSMLFWNNNGQTSSFYDFELVENK